MGMKMNLVNRITLRGVSSVYLFCVLILPETTSLIKKYVRKGESTSLKCVVEPENNYSSVWIFNNKVIYTKRLPYPRDIGIDNACGEIVNNTHSNLYIHQFQAKNEGNYTCSLNQKNYSEYVLKLIDDRSQPMNSTSHLQLHVNLNSSVHEGIVFFPKGESVFLNCLFSIPGNASLHWTMQTTVEENEGERKNFQRNNYETCYIEAQLSFTLVENINVTCHVTQESFGSLQGNVTISISIQTNDSSEILQAEDTNYTLLFVTVCIIPLVVFGSVMLISVACWIRRRRKTDIHYTDGISIYCEVELPKESNVSTQPTPLAYKRVT
ncbi:uncharacterized protein [Apostichopus japonicus]|uniref:uncharacterized protein n=1 Tax=Stichopus japonicus TaxID=307972 RepID=UPI003AB47CD4